MHGAVPYALILAPVAAFCFTIAALSWRRRPKPAATPLAGVGVGAGLWVLMSLFRVLFDDFGISVFVAKASYLGITLTVAAWFVLALEYTGRERYLTPRAFGLLAVEPLVVQMLIWTNGTHDLFWPEVWANDSVYGFGSTAGAGFWAHAVYSYVLLFVGAVLILTRVYRSNAVYRGQSAAMLLGLIAPWAGNVLYLAGITAIDGTPIGFASTCILIYWAMNSYDLMDVAPVARDTVLDRIPSGVVVIDPDDRVTDANAEMERLLGASTTAMIGREAAEVFADWPTLYEFVADETDCTDEISLRTDDGISHFAVEIAPIRDDRNRFVGRVVLVHDVSEQKRRERELERQNEQLDQFASLVSHDLRNPLNVASGHANLLEETRDFEHLERIHASHERMEDLIRDVRTLVKQGQTVTDRNPIDLADVARTAERSVDTGNATVVIEDVGVVRADRSRLLRAFENLFRNSVEHGSTSSRSKTDDAVEHGTPTDDEPLTIRVGRIDGDDPAGDGFYVEDDGPGIPPDRREKVFDQGYTTGQSGTGLGLAIVESAFASHDWTVAVTESPSRTVVGEARTQTVADTSDPQPGSWTGGGARFEITGVEFVETN